MATKLLAQDAITNPALGPTLQSLDSGDAFFNLFIPKAIGMGLVIGVLIFFVTMLMGAIQWISSGGDKANLEAARGKLTSAIVGITILFILFAVLNLIQDFFGIPILELNLGPLKIEP